MKQFILPIQNTRKFSGGYLPSANIEAVAQELGVDKEAIIKLDSGENLWAPHLDFSGLLNQTNLALYPDSNGQDVRQTLAQQLGVQPENIVLGNGSDELIDLLCRAFLGPNKVLVDFIPTFPMFKKFAQASGGKVQEVLRRPDFSLDMPAAKQALQKSDLAFLANPNNPTGTLTPEAEVVMLLETGKIVVVDEAYFEFCGTSMLPLLSRFPNLVILRTFSKWAGIAGIRVGFAIADASIMRVLDTLRAPYNVNSLAQAIAKQALAEKDRIMESVTEICEGRDWFIQAMKELPSWQVIPSQASCVTLIPTEQESTATAQQLRQQGILVKPLSLPGLPNALRVSCAPVSIMEKVFLAFKAL